MRRRWCRKITTTKKNILGCHKKVFHERVCRYVTQPINFRHPTNKKKECCTLVSEKIYIFFVNSTMKLNLILNYVCSAVCWNSFYWFWWHIIHTASVYALLVRSTSQRVQWTPHRFCHITFTERTATNVWYAGKMLNQRRKKRDERKIIRNLFKKWNTIHFTQLMSSFTFSHLTRKFIERTRRREKKRFFF